MSSLRIATSFVTPTADSPPIVDRLRPDETAERAQLAAGLRAAQASIAPRWLYDALGCALFGAICELPEYYLTRTERAIVDAHRDDMAREIGRGRQWIDLGAGDCSKGEAWIPCVAPSRYLAVDVARVAIEPALARIARRHPALDVAGVLTDFARRLDLEADLDGRAALFFYPGSSIGNFAPAEALAFLQAIRGHCARRPGSGLLIGVDLRKPRATLEAAYDDALGVTAAFNRNVLLHVNRILGTGFDPSAFAHLARYDEGEGRIEMYLVATRDVVVRLDGDARPFAAGERIHTENSYKYAPGQFEALLARAGFGRIRCWRDAGDAFAVFYAA
jgi:dimethylhistidine N-methyltransferase